VRYIISLLLCTLVLFQGSNGADLYKVNINSQADADALRAMNVEPLVWVDDGYLVLADRTSADQIARSHLDALLLAEDVSKDQLALDGRLDGRNAARYRVIYEADGVRLLLLEDKLSVAVQAAENLSPVRNEHLTIEYRARLPLDAWSPEVTVAGDEILDALLAEVKQDSLYNYVCSLQAYPYRVVGTDANLGARQWVYDKFVELGYANTFVDPVPYPYDCANVIAYKAGNLYPERIIIVGGHFDAVLRSPGADDNGSGTAATLEIARVLKDADLDATVIFVAFDAEESGLIGAYDVADSAVAEAWDILFVMNMDMIGAEGNTDSAFAYHGPEQAYALLWGNLAQEYEGLKTAYSSSSRSDHFPFQQAGYDVVFGHEYRFSDVYHTERDSTTHMNFGYMTKMVRSSLATVYTVSQIPRGTAVTGLQQVGDGQSIQVTWEPADPAGLVTYRVCYIETYDPTAEIQYVEVPDDVTTRQISGLTEGVDYTLFVQVVDDQGRVSLPYFRSDRIVPTSTPEAPAGVLALPLKEAIIITWNQNNCELDFDHYDIVRDGEIIDATGDTSYVDSDPSLGTDFHAYQVMAVDLDGNSSDTLGIEPVIQRAATLDLSRILAINRSSKYNVDFVSAEETGVFLQEALEGYDYDYYCDTLATTHPDEMPQLDLWDMLDYGTLVIGAETGHQDDLGLDPYWNGILDTLAYYLSIGGRLVVFGRWGEVSGADTIDYGTNPYHYDDAYEDYFHIDRRVITPTTIVLTHIEADLVGAHSLAEGYPDLEWDSTLTMLHSTAHVLTVTSVGGIPCESFVELVEGSVEPIYAYDSRNDDPLSEGETVAWRYIGDTYSYAWFDIPLSHFNRPVAISALQQAVDDVRETKTLVEDEPGGSELPGSFALRQNYPNPFNPHTEIVYSLPVRSQVTLSIYNVLGQRVRNLVDREQPAGTYMVQWDGTSDAGEVVATGIYFYRLKAGDSVQAKKMMLLK